MLQALCLQGFEAPHKTAADRNRTVLDNDKY